MFEWRQKYFPDDAQNRGIHHQANLYLAPSHPGISLTESQFTFSEPKPPVIIGSFRLRLGDYTSAVLKSLAAVVSQLNLLFLLLTNSLLWHYTGIDPCYGIFLFYLHFSDNAVYILLSHFNHIVQEDPEYVNRLMRRTSSI